MEDQQKSDLLGQREVRLEKLEQLKKLGINPYPAKSFKQYSNGEVKGKYEEFENKEVILAGRIVAWREHGKLVFGNIQDQSDSI